MTPRPSYGASGRHPRLYFGGASEAAERVVGRPRPTSSSSGASRSTASPSGSTDCGGSSGNWGASTPRSSSACGSRRSSATRPRRPGTRPRRRSPRWPNGAGSLQRSANPRFKAVGQQRLLDLAERGDVLDTCLYTAPGGTAAAAPARPGSSAPRRRRCRAPAVRRARHHATSCCRTRRTSARSSVRATSSSRCSADPPPRSPRPVGDAKRVQEPDSATDSEAQRSPGNDFMACRPSLCVPRVIH